MFKFSIASLVLAGALALAHPTAATAQPAEGVDDYTFHGYVSCNSGEAGCYQWPIPPYSWLVWRDISHLPAIACKQRMVISHALAPKIGSCDPPLTLP